MPGFAVQLLNTFIASQASQALLKAAASGNRSAQISQLANKPRISLTPQEEPGHDEKPGQMKKEIDGKRKRRAGKRLERFIEENTEALTAEELSCLQSQVSGSRLRVVTLTTANRQVVRIPEALTGTETPVGQSSPCASSRLQH